MTVPSVGKEQRFPVFRQFPVPHYDVVIKIIVHIGGINFIIMVHYPIVFELPNTDILIACPIYSRVSNRRIFLVYPHSDGRFENPFPLNGVVFFFFFSTGHQHGGEHIHTKCNVFSHDVGILSCDNSKTFLTPGLLQGGEKNFKKQCNNSGFMALHMKNITP